MLAIIYHDIKGSSMRYNCVHYDDAHEDTHDVAHDMPYIILILVLEYVE